MRDASLSSHRQAHSHPGVVVHFISAENGGAIAEKPPRNNLYLIAVSEEIGYSRPLRLHSPLRVSRSYECSACIQHLRLRYWTVLRMRPSADQLAP